MALNEGTCWAAEDSKALVSDSDETAADGSVHCPPTRADVRVASELLTADNAGTSVSVVAMAAVCGPEPCCPDALFMAVASMEAAHKAGVMLVWRFLG